MLLLPLHCLFCTLFDVVLVLLPLTLSGGGYTVLLLVVTTYLTLPDGDVWKNLMSQLLIVVGGDLVVSTVVFLFFVVVGDSGGIVDVLGVLLGI